MSEYMIMIYVVDFRVLSGSFLPLFTGNSQFLNIFIPNISTNDDKKVSNLATVPPNLSTLHDRPYDT